MIYNGIDSVVYEGIRKTISRFRRKPFHYFTEADIHSSLLTPVVQLIKDYIKNGQVTDRKDKKFIHPQEVATVFIESFIGDQESKITMPPIAFLPQEKWARELSNYLKIK